MYKGYNDRSDTVNSKLTISDSSHFMFQIYGQFEFHLDLIPIDSHVYVNADENIQKAKEIGYSIYRSNKNLIQFVCIKITFEATKNSPVDSAGWCKFMVYADNNALQNSTVQYISIILQLYCILLLTR